MQLQWEKTQVPILRRKVWEVQNQEQTLEVRLGEDMPDIGYVICGWGQPLLRGKEWRSDSISISGGVMAWILYAPEDGSNPRSVEAWLPFQMKWNLPDSQRDGFIRADVSLRMVDARVLSARKMMVRAQLSVLGEGLEPDNAAYYSPSEADDKIQLLKRIYPLQVPAEAGEKTILLDEDLTISGMKPAKLISCALWPKMSDQKVVGGKAVFRGDCGVHLVYFGDDGHIHSQDLSIPFAQYADLDKDYDKDAQVTAMITPANMEPELLEDGLRLKCGLVVQYVILDHYMLDVAQDAYSLTHGVVPEMQTLEMPVVLDRRNEQHMISQTAPCEHTDIVDSCCFWEQSVIRRSGAQVDVEMPGMAQVLCRDANGKYAGMHIRFADQWSLPAGEGSTIFVSARPADVPAVSTDGENMTVQLAFDNGVTAMADQQIPMISGIEVGEKLPENTDRPSMILRRAGGDSLWDIAKNYGSTVDAIRAANALEDTVPDNQMLLIPVS